ncbi:MAG: hypothetical protein KR126chlam1_00822 [Chlamydiae bacterium]|nr:hypothetical protein [Chlamydiota bacterium]
MADIGKVEGDINRPEPSSPKKKKGTDSKAFKEMMKVGKVRETDPEEQRKRKRPSESEEEQQAAQTTPLPRQGLDEELAEPSPYEPTSVPKEREIPTTEGAPRPPLTAPPPTSAEGVEGTPSTTAPTEKPSEPTQAKKAAPPKAKKRAEKLKKEKEAPPLPVKGAKKEALAETAAKQKKVEESKEAFFQQMTPAQKKEIEEKGEGQKPVTEGAPSTLPPGAWEAIQPDEKEAKVKEKETEETLISAPRTDAELPTAQPTAITEPLPPLAAPFANLHPQVVQLFERMVGVMTVMHESGITETTINLDNPQYANSRFFGAQIVIREFSTAPKVFNIELRGNDEATTLFSANAQELVAAFQGANYNFTVGRVDTSYLPSEMRKKAQRVTRKKGKGKK